MILGTMSRKKGYVEIYSGVYVEKGEDIKENVSDEEKSLYEDNEFYCYTNDGKCEIFDEHFEFLDEDYEEDELFVVAYRLFRWFR